MIVIVIVPSVWSCFVDPFPNLGICIQMHSVASLPILLRSCDSVECIRPFVQKLARQLRFEGMGDLESKDQFGP